MKKLWDISNDTDRLHIKSLLLFARIVGAISFIKSTVLKCCMELLHTDAVKNYIHHNITIVKKEW